MCIKHNEFSKGHYYHVYNHAVSGQMMFRDRIDFENAVKLMNRHSVTQDFTISVYCFMPTHFHFVLYQKSEHPAYAFIYKWCNAYSRYYNTRHHTLGTIFSDKLQSVFIENEEDLPWLNNQILLNPVTDNLVTDARDWEWSGCPDQANLNIDNHALNNIITEHWSIEQHLSDINSNSRKTAKRLKLLIDK